MTDRAHLLDLLWALQAAIARYQGETEARLSILEKRDTAMEARITALETVKRMTWTELLRLAISIKIASPHLWSLLTFLSALIGKALRWLLGL